MIWTVDPQGTIRPADHCESCHQQSTLLREAFHRGNGRLLKVCRSCFRSKYELTNRMRGPFPFCDTYVADKQVPQPSVVRVRDYVVKDASGATINNYGHDERELGFLERVERRVLECVTPIVFCIAVGLVLAVSACFALLVGVAFDTFGPATIVDHKLDEYERLTDSLEKRKDHITLSDVMSFSIQGHQLLKDLLATGLSTSNPRFQQIHKRWKAATEEVFNRHKADFARMDAELYAQYRSIRNQ